MAADPKYIEALKAEHAAVKADDIYHDLGDKAKAKRLADIEAEVVRVGSKIESAVPAAKLERAVPEKA